MKFKDTEYGDLTGKHYEGGIDVSKMGLTSLEGAPKSVSGSFDCSYNALTSLQYAPAEVSRSFNCRDNKITSFAKSSLKKVGWAFSCGWNSITSLKGCPNSVGDGFYCNDNKLTTLLGMSDNIKGIVNVSTNPNPHLEREYHLRKAHPEMSEKEISKEMYKLTKDTLYLPAALKKVFLIKDKK